MATIQTITTEGFRTRVKHLHSGAEIFTDAPLDNHGKGENFSPTDLLAASLGSCMITIMDMAGKEHGFSVVGSEVIITKIMSANPRKVDEIIVELNFPKSESYSEKSRKVIEYAAHSCPVALSLHPDVKQTIVFNY